MEMDAFSSRSAENTLSVRPDRQYDPHYRYRMPPLDSAADNRNKQRKTRLHNAAAVARNIFRPEAWLVKFMALELSTDSSSSAGAAYLTGHHPLSETRWHRPRPARSPRASLSARVCLRLPKALASLGQSASRAALAGHTGLEFDAGHRTLIRTSLALTPTTDPDQATTSRRSCRSSCSASSLSTCSASVAARYAPLGCNPM